MEIKLKNIGIIQNSSIKMNGLTIITGSNNSGKTTIGKVVYSLIDAVSNLQIKYENDRLQYISKCVEKVESTLDIFRYIRHAGPKIIDSIFDESRTIQIIIYRNYKREIDLDKIEEFAQQLLLDLKSFENNMKKLNKILKPYNENVFKRMFSENFEDEFNKQRIKSIEILENLFNDLDKDLELINYTRESINQTLNLEFAHQIQPLKIDVESSSIEILDENLSYFKLDIINNKIVDDGNPVFSSSPYSKTYFIDDPFILDDAPIRKIFRDQEIEDSNSLLNTERLFTHDNKLKNTLRSTKQTSIFEENVIKESLAIIKEKIDEILPGEFEFKVDGEYYVQNGKKLQISNLATGSKMFSIIKILLEKGEIDDSTILILDEPEAHLHPSWQNKFAEILVLLVKQLEVNILLTSHSPNFVLALDAYMRKYDINEKTNFYQTETIENGLVQYECVNNDMDKIYSDFVRYLSEVKVLRNEYMENTGDNV